MGRLGIIELPVQGFVFGLDTLVFLDSTGVGHLNCGLAPDFQLRWAFELPVQGLYFQVGT